MPPLPVISGADAVEVLSKLGYRIQRQRGSHVRLNAAGRSPVTVPLHKAPDRGTLRAIIRTVDLSVAQFVKLLES